MVKIDGIEIKDHRKTFTGSFLIALIAFSTGVLAYHYIFMILPSRPGCVQVSVKDAGGQAVQGTVVEIYISIFGEAGDKVAEAFTDMGGKVRFCDKFEPDKEYRVIVKGPTGEELWSGFFATNERSTADFPIIVRQEHA
jgi:hypothetical protein